MKYQIGEVCLDKVTEQKIIFPNKTRKYLMPCVYDYGEEFVKRLNNCFKVAVGLGDMIITRRYYKAPERHLFILLDSSIAKAYFIDFLDWVKEQPMYEDDYVYGNIQKTTMHMIVLKFPKRYYNSFEAFNKGKYSEMFTQEAISRLFKSKDNAEAPLVLIKDSNYNIKFTEKLNKIFGTTLKSGEYEGELDLPPDDEEIFNSHLKD